MKNLLFGLAMACGVATVGAGEARAAHRYGNDCDDRSGSSYSAYDYRPSYSRTTAYPVSSYPYARSTTSSLGWNSHAGHGHTYNNYSTSSHNHYVPARPTYSSTYSNDWNSYRPSNWCGTTTTTYPRSGYGW